MSNSTSFAGCSIRVATSWREQRIEWRHGRDAAATSPSQATTPQPQFTASGLSPDELARIREAARERAQEFPPMSGELVSLVRNLMLDTPS